MMHLQDYKLFESHNFPTDKGEIKKILVKYGLARTISVNGKRETNYTIHPDGTVDVVGTVDLRKKGLRKLPLKFGKIEGTFSCSCNSLTSLEGAPHTVWKDFDCSRNKLTTLKGAPTKVGELFFAYQNELFTLEGLTENTINQTAWFRNPVENVEMVFQGKEKLIESLKYNYFAGGNKIHESRFVRACDDLGIPAPDEIKGYVWV